MAKAYSASKRYCQCSPEEYPPGFRLSYCFTCRAQRPPYTNAELDATIERMRANPLPGNLPSAAPKKDSDISAPELVQLGQITTKWRSPNKELKRFAFFDRSLRAGICHDGTAFRARSNSLLDVLSSVPSHIGIVYLLGKAPKKYSDVRGWGGGVVPENWTRGESYLGDDFLFRFRRPDNSLLEISSASIWDLQYVSAGQAVAALNELNARTRVRFHGAQIGTTPLNTGRRLFQSSIPYDAARNTSLEIPVCSPEHQAIIQRTAAQGRFEYLGRPDHKLKGLAELDGRLMYAHCAKRLFVGPGLFTKGNKAPIASSQDFQRQKDDLSFVPGRYLVRFSVPRPWAHIGLLGHWDANSKTRTYPATPGFVGEGWADGAELLLAADQGWTFEIYESLTFDRLEGKNGPLDDWVNGLLRVEKDLAGSPAERSIRSMIIKTIGGFSQRGHMVEKRLPKDQAANVPMERAPQLIGEEWHWTEPQALRSPELSHPEWSAHIWARCRARMAALALEFPREQIVGLSLDGLFLDVDDASEFPVECEVGHLRLKSFTSTTATVSSLDDLRGVRDSNG